MPTKLNILLTFFVLFTYFPHSSKGLLRCYSCRSRGELGTCKDPFDVKQNLTRVDTTLCASGWCTKLIEAEDAFKEEYGTATERRCLQRGPSDNEERCAYTVVQRKKVYMCFCKGDLCNNSYKLIADFKLAIVTIAYILYQTILGTNSV